MFRLCGRAEGRVGKQAARVGSKGWCFGLGGNEAGRYGGSQEGPARTGGRESPDAG